MGGGGSDRTNQRGLAVADAEGNARAVTLSHPGRSSLHRLSRTPKPSRGNSEMETKQGSLVISGRRPSMRPKRVAEPPKLWQLG
jgi:hypothetical protein